MHKSVRLLNGVPLVQIKGYCTCKFEPPGWAMHHGPGMALEDDGEARGLNRVDEPEAAKVMGKARRIRGVNAQMIHNSHEEWHGLEVNANAY